MAFIFEQSLQKAMRLEKSGHPEAAVSFLSDELVSQGLRKAIADGLARDALAGNIDDSKALIKAARERLFGGMKDFDHDFSKNVGLPSGNTAHDMNISAKKKFGEQDAPKYLKKSEDEKEAPKEEKEEEGGDDKGGAVDPAPKGGPAQAGGPGALGAPQPQTGGDQAPTGGPTAGEVASAAAPQMPPAIDATAPGGAPHGAPGQAPPGGAPPTDPMGGGAPLSQAPAGDEQAQIASLIDELQALLAQEAGPLAQQPGQPVDAPLGSEKQGAPGAMPHGVGLDATAQPPGKQMDDNIPEGTGGPVQDEHGFHKPEGAGQQEDDETAGSDPVEKGFYGIYKGNYGVVKFDAPNPFEGGRFAKSDVVPSGELETGAESFVFDRLKNGKKHNIDRKSKD